MDGGKNVRRQRRSACLERENERKKGEEYRLEKAAKGKKKLKKTKGGKKLNGVEQKNIFFYLFFLFSFKLFIPFRRKTDVRKWNRLFELKNPADLIDEGKAERRVGTESSREDGGALRWQNLRGCKSDWRVEKA